MTDKNLVTLEIDIEDNKNSFKGTLPETNLTQLVTDLNSNLNKYGTLIIKEVDLVHKVIKLTTLETLQYRAIKSNISSIEEIIYNHIAKKI